jgi:hypothetical protein
LLIDDNVAHSRFPCSPAGLRDAFHSSPRECLRRARSARTYMPRLWCCRNWWCCGSGRCSTACLPRRRCRRGNAPVQAFPSSIGWHRPVLRQGTGIHSTSSADIHAPTLVGRTLDLQWKAPGTNSRLKGSGDKDDQYLDDQCLDDQCSRFSVGAEACRGTSRGWKGWVDRRGPMSWSRAWFSSPAMRYQGSDRRWTDSGDTHAPRRSQGTRQTRIWREAREQSAFSFARFLAWDELGRVRGIAWAQTWARKWERRCQSVWCTANPQAADKFHTAPVIRRALVRG